ncbi:MAG: hypothetical protein J1F10_00425 [Muribaculaceae bacterium]|nr:hypothetical protein [Muribaculaceae bacterium]
MALFRKQNKKEKKVPAKKKKKLSFIRRIWLGEIISYQFFFKYWKYVAIIVLVFVVYTSSRYEVRDRMDRIIKLKNELANARTEKVKASANYNSLIREQEMRNRLKNADINLQVPDQPPYHISSINNK